MKLRRVAGYGPAFVLTITILALWELYVRSGQISSTVLPSPIMVVQALIENWDIISVHTMQTLLETVIGLAVATLLGLLLAVALDISTWMRRAVYPILVTSQTIPIIALAPLLVLWFGFDLQPKVIVVVLYCFFPIAVACADGLLATDPDPACVLPRPTASPGLSSASMSRPTRGWVFTCSPRITRTPSCWSLPPSSSQRC